MTTTSANASSSRERIVISPGSPGPAPTKATRPGAVNGRPTATRTVDGGASVNGTGAR